MRKVNVCLLALVLCAGVVSAEPDNGKVLPSKEVPQVNHIFFEWTGGLCFPLSFVTQDFLPMTRDRKSVV